MQNIITYLESFNTVYAAVLAVLGLLAFVWKFKKKHVTDKELELINDIRDKNYVWQMDKTDDNLVELAQSIHTLITHYNDHSIQDRSDALYPFWKSFYQENTHDAVHNLNSINLQKL